MDIKITGLTREIVENAMTQAKEGRHHILDEMSKTISEPRTGMKEGVPVMKSLQIKQDQIGGLIGPGGKNIKKLQENYDLDIEISEDGLVKFISTNTENIDKCMALVALQLNGPEIGTEYSATVVTIKEYGAFVDIADGVSGLVHISEFADERVRDPADYVDEGEVIKVKVLEIDRMGRVKLSAKAAAPIARKRGSAEEDANKPAPKPSDRDSRDSRDNRGRGRGPRRDSKGSKDES